VLANLVHLTSSLHIGVDANRPLSRLAFGVGGGATEEIVLVAHGKPAKRMLWAD
jgi:hypothetical protein